MTIVFAFALVTLAAARVTRLVVDDKITLPLRVKVIKRFGPEGWLTTLVHCPYCVSVWICLPGSAFWAFTSLGWVWALLWLVPAWLAMAHLVAPILLKLGQED